MRKDWTAIFDSIHYGALLGASKETLSLFVENCANQLNGGIKIEFPTEYLDFLRFCNTGITTMTGNRELQFFTTENLIKNNVDYGLPMYLKGAISIAMDGSGHHIFFDATKNDGKFYGVHSSDLDWDETKLLAENFTQLCEEKTRIDALMWAS